MDTSVSQGLSVIFDRHHKEPSWELKGFISNPNKLDKDCYVDEMELVKNGLNQVSAT